MYPQEYCHVAHSSVVTYFYIHDLHRTDLSQDSGEAQVT